MKIEGHRWSTHGHRGSVRQGGPLYSVVFTTPVMQVVVVVGLFHLYLKHDYFYND